MKGVREPLCVKRDLKKKEERYLFLQVKGFVCMIQWRWYFVFATPKVMLVCSMHLVVCIQAILFSEADENKLFLCH